jgi:hypothetical protein
MSLKPFTNNYKKVFLLAIEFFALVYFLVKAFQAWILFGYLPASMKISGVVTTAYEIHFTHDCGGAIFKISQSSIDSLTRDDALYLSSAPKSRNGKRFFEKWQKSPVPENTWYSDGPWPTLAFTCMGLFDTSLLNSIKNESLMEGSFFTTDHLHEYELLILPKSGYIIIFFMVS